MIAAQLERRPIVALILTVALALCAGGCAGGLDVGPKDQPEPDGASTLTPPGIGGHGGGGADGSAAPQLDAGALPPPDTTAPDTVAAPTPDTQPPKPDQGGTTPPPPPTSGQPCPCTGGLVCVAGFCRAKCNTPTDPCGVVSNCPPTEACLPTNGGFSVCVPAAQPGAPCGQSAWCPVNHVCGSVNGSSYTCLPVCNNPGGACGSGGAGQCLKTTTGCSFCSSV